MTQGDSDLSAVKRHIQRGDTICIMAGEKDVHKAVETRPCCKQFQIYRRGGQVHRPTLQKTSWCLRLDETLHVEAGNLSCSTTTTGRKHAEDVASLMYGKVSEL